VVSECDFVVDEEGSNTSSYSDQPPDRGDLPNGYKPARIEDRFIYIDAAHDMHNNYGRF